MAILPIVIFPDDRLRKKCLEVSKVTDATRKLLQDMSETMYDAPGIGLAAPQIGVLQRLIVVDLGPRDNANNSEKLYKIINPIITSVEGEIESEEGCLSIPEIRDTIKRHAVVRVEGYDENEKPLTIDAEGLLAVCLQHEIDHLNGVLFIDHLSKLKREMIKSKLKKQKR